eukprot:gene8145-12606_t
MSTPEVSQNNRNNIKTTITLMTIGCQGSGKSSMINSWLSGFYSPSLKIESKCRLLIKLMFLLVSSKIKIDNKDVKIIIFDVPTQEEFEQERKKNILESDGFLIIVDLTKKEEFSKIKTDIEEIKKIKQKKEIPMLIIGNKKDLTQEKEEFEEISKKLNCKYFLTSSKENENLNEIFEEISKLTYQYLNKKKKKEVPNLNLSSRLSIPNDEGEKKSPSLKEKLSSFWNNINSPSPKPLTKTNNNTPSHQNRSSTKNGNLLTNNETPILKLNLDEEFDLETEEEIAEDSEEEKEKRRSNLLTRISSIDDILKKDFNENCLNFYEQVESFKLKNNVDLFNESIEIISKFILPKSSEEIPIEKEERNLLVLKYKNIKEKEFPIDFFDSLQKKSKNILEFNFLKKFLLSDDFIEYLFNEENLLFLENNFYERMKYDSILKKSGINSIDLRDESIVKEVLKQINGEEEEEVNEEKEERIIRRMTQIKTRRTSSFKPENVYSYYNTNEILELPILNLSNEDIIFEDEKNIIKCATIDKIIEFITNSKNFDNHSLFTFMLCYRSFISSNDLMNKLKIRYLTPYPIELNNSISDQLDWISSELIPIRLKILQLLKLWIEQHFYDFLDEKVELNLMNFIKIMENTNGKKYANTIQKTFEKMKLNDSKKLKEKSILSNLNFKKRNSIFEWSLKDVAKQITMREYLIFKNIKPSECVNKSWSLKNRQEISPNILKLIDWFNLFSNFIGFKILESPNLKERTKCLSFFINLANEFKNLNNFNGIYCIVSSLNNASIHRLKHTFNLIQQKEKLLLQELQLYVSNDSNFKFIRDQTSLCIPPLVPYLGIFLTDLTFIDEGNQDFIDDKINFTKVKRVSTIIKNLKVYQQTPFDIHLIEQLQNFFDQLDFRLDEDEMYELSLLREPRER